ncbi:helix-turn-helix transcriptional regulator [Streptomyces sp. NPDC012935]|uniref:helix-turn-helix transcriptional regulator n=1 Tax=Streptomyces sp. NPDC012935 TaxID=3364857 RepID=UPI003691F37C
MRFQNARGAVAGAVAVGCAPHLARVAAECGSYNHSHLVRDFRQYTGLSPTAWPAEECRNVQAAGHRERADPARLDLWPTLQARTLPP